MRLTADLREEVLSVAAAKLGSSEIELIEKVDAAVIGGIRLSIGGREFDATIAAQLEQLKN